jgi:hypothetical protein
MPKCNDCAQAAVAFNYNVYCEDCWPIQPFVELVTGGDTISFDKDAGTLPSSTMTPFQILTKTSTQFWLCDCCHYPIVVGEKYTRCNKTCDHRVCSYCFKQDYYGCGPFFE